MSLCNLIRALKSPFSWGNWRKMGFYNQLLQLFLSKATNVLVACNKNSRIGQVKKTHISFSVIWLRKLIGETWLKCLFLQMSWLFFWMNFLIWWSVIHYKLSISRFNDENHANSFIHNSYISHIDIMHWKHIFHKDL